ncbi:MAG: 6-carboxytetrahydropterin synthase [Planctomycetaceae bacterium]|nr:6-carboxytetrahydropterin synthase [Planctomycetaceae bacterium]MCA9414440.1 6-carboxytetrahydropterin synthase [Candidatus Omnitrophota bacterium]
MFRVSQEIDFCYGHRLLNYDGKCKHLHGHNGRLIIVLEAENLDERGMLVDFGDIKRSVRTWVDNELDHRMILNRNDPIIPYLQSINEPMYLIDWNPTAENIARLVYEYTAKQGLPVKEVLLWETPKSYATYSESR